MGKREVIKKIKEFINLIKINNIKVEKVYLFGSYAVNRAKESSDIDVAVISPDFGINYTEESLFLMKIAQKIDLQISPEPYSLKEYQAASQGEFLWQEIINKGQLIKV
ncbi:MAG TPA: nucleotidyltransferase domain-containing protein [Cyanobacteria bacterium UBA9971]|nr:nucleotidyltransferase domain-containing protein [Cyanobacteria bacterium UBA9971]